VRGGGGAPDGKRPRPVPQGAAGTDRGVPRNNVEKCGNVITKAGSRADAIRSAESAIRKIFLRLRPLRGATDEFLFHDKTAVKAFTLSHRRHREWYEGLPECHGDPRRFEPTRPLILDFPGLAGEAICDWHGFDPVRARDLVGRVSGARFVDGPRDDGFVLGKIFWSAFFAGGAQGAVYLLDTLGALRDSPGRLREYLEAKRS